MLVRLRVNICGQIDMICFDKTGTLTEEGVDVMGVMSVNETTQLSPLQAVDNATLSMQRCLATCHGLTSVGGELVGDPLDLKMFEATKWALEEPEAMDQETSVVPPIVYPPADLAHPHFLHAMKQFGLTTVPGGGGLAPVMERTSPKAATSPIGKREGSCNLGAAASSLPKNMALAKSPKVGSAISPTGVMKPASLELSDLKWGLSEHSSGNPRMLPVKAVHRRNADCDAAGAAAQRKKESQDKRFGLAIVKRFDFTSMHQRMSVVVSPKP